MAKYDVTYSCGHSGVVQLFGKEKDRQSKIKWYESEAVCPDCWKKKVDNERKREYTIANDFAKDNNYPDLEGTEKQINWAESIRMKVMKHISERGKHIKAEKKEDWKKLVEWYKSQKEAVFWIDNRTADLEPTNMLVRRYLDRIDS